jgi:hypothetical protein
MIKFYVFSIGLRRADGTVALVRMHEHCLRINARISPSLTVSGLAFMAGDGESSRLKGGSDCIN